MIREDLERILERLDLLPEKQSVLIRLVHLKGIPVKWAAPILGITEARASRLIYKAVQTIKKLLKKGGCRGRSGVTDSESRSIS